MAPPLQYQHDVVGGAATRARKHRLHRPRREVLPAVLRFGRVRCAIHHQDVATARFGDKAHGRTRPRVAGPTYCAFHDSSDSSQDGWQNTCQRRFVWEKRHSLVAMQQTVDILYFIAHTFAPTVVSSTLPIGGFSPESQDSGLFYARKPQPATAL